MDIVPIAIEGSGDWMHAFSKSLVPPPGDLADRRSAHVIASEAVLHRRTRLSSPTVMREAVSLPPGCGVAPRNTWLSGLSSEVSAAAKKSLVELQSEFLFVCGYAGIANFHALIFAHPFRRMPSTPGTMSLVHRIYATKRGSRINALALVRNL